MSSNETALDQLSQGRWLIPVNSHLHEGGPCLDIDKLLMVRDAGQKAFELAIPEAQESNLLRNLISISEEFIRQVFALHGEQALLRLYILASGHDEHEFKHFWEVIDAELWLGSVKDTLAPRKLNFDNRQLRASSDIERFSHNVVDSGISRKLYIPGRRPGFLVYGLGGPRILLSVPFHGTDRYHYPVFENSIDIVTSLMARGYFGNFLVLDRLDSLAAEYHGLPGWLVWFSYIASQSDMVLFVTERGAGLSTSQQREAELTPNRIPKKIVELGDGELVWAKSSSVKTVQSLETLYLAPGMGHISKAEYLQTERAFAEQHINSYDRGAYPSDRLIAFHEDGRILEFPLEDAG